MRVPKSFLGTRVIISETDCRNLFDLWDEDGWWVWSSLSLPTIPVLAEEGGVGDSHPLLYVRWHEHDFKSIDDQGTGSPGGMKSSELDRERLKT